MKYLLNAQEMRSCDNYTIEELLIPAIVLMERAALGVMELIRARLSDIHKPIRKSRILCLCGTGNNGGDGLAVTRLLLDEGAQVHCVWIGDPMKASELNKKQRAILEKYDCPILSEFTGHEYDIILDAVFGIGLTRQLSKEYIDLFCKVNLLSGYKIAVDVPSGINADNGMVQGAAIKCDTTAAIAFEKRGHYLYPGTEYAGKIICLDIGITKQSFYKELPAMFTHSGKLTIHRKASGNKGTFGKVLLIAGSDAMSGAALLAGRAAYRSGAGMVKIVTTESNRIIMQESLPEALLLTYDEASFDCDLLVKDFECSLLEAMNWADCIGIGPGLSTSMQAASLLKAILTKGRIPLLIDADGINLLAKEKEFIELLMQYQEINKQPVIITPHLGELARLRNCKVEEIQRDLTRVSEKTASEYGCVAVVKDARTHVCQKGRPVYLNTSGNSGMATAGSGDVLTGMILGIVAQKLPPYEACIAGVYLHGIAGDLAAERLGQGSMMASDLIENIKV